MIRSLLHAMAGSPRLGRFITSNSVTRRMSRRFVAGEGLAEAISAARVLNAAGMHTSLDLLGENTSSEADARRARDEYLAVFDRIAAESLDANVSCKLTQLGLDLGENVCLPLVDSIVEHAAGYNNFLRIDMEGSAYTERTLQITNRARAKSNAVGVVIQAYLYRSEKDVDHLLSIGCRIRLCKGAYREPAEVAFQSKSDVDANFVKLMQKLLPSGVYHGIATHDPRMIDATVAFAAKNAIAKDKFEFQMLYGIRTDLQQQLIRDGYHMRVYIPYGVDWFPYFMRRLAERPANLLFFARHLMGGK